MNLPQVVIEKMAEVYSKNKGKKCIVCGKSIRKFREIHMRSLKSAYDRKICSIECSTYDRKSLQAMNDASKMIDSLLYLERMASRKIVERSKRDRINTIINKVINSQTDKKYYVKVIKKKIRQPPIKRTYQSYRYFLKFNEPKIIKPKKFKYSIRNEILTNRDKWERATSYVDELKSIGSNHSYYNEVSSDLKIPQTPTITI